MKRHFLPIIISFITLTGCAQSQRSQLGKEWAEKELKEALTQKEGHSVIDNKNLIIKDNVTAVAIAEPILFGIYGEDNITRQRPYEIYLIDNYWVLNGTLPEKMVGGTFMIIIDARNSKVLRITHGK